MLVTYKAANENYQVQPEIGNSKRLVLPILRNLLPHSHLPASLASVIT